MQKFPVCDRVTLAISRELRETAVVMPSPMLGQNIEFEVSDDATQNRTVNLPGTPEQPKQED